MKVVDTNILAYLTLESSPAPLRRSARLLAKKDPAWIFPSLWRHEYLNLLATLLRADLISTAQALNTWYNAAAVWHSQEASVDSARALELCRQYQVSAYDAQFLALAETAGQRLVTEDRKLRRQAPALTQSLQEALAL